jgi:hypothetical protein
VLTRGPQLHTRPLGEAGQPHAIEHVESCAQLITGLPPPMLAAQPLTIEQVGTSELGSGPGPAEQVQRILILLAGLGRADQQSPGPGEQSQGQWRAGSGRAVL